MKILFDLSATQPANGIINHGGGEYARSVFIKLCEEHVSSVSVFYNSEPGLDSDLRKILESNNVTAVTDPSPGSLKSFIKENGINIFYSALPRKEFIPLLKLQSDRFKVIFTIHGLRQLELPYDSYEWLYLNTLREKIRYVSKILFTPVYRSKITRFYNEIIKADHIITVSDSSRRSLVRSFPGIESKISVLFSPALTYNQENGNEIQVLSEFGLEEKEYFLIVSGSLWVKNSYRAIKAFDNLLSMKLIDPRFKMIVTGMKGSMKTKNSGNFVFSEYLKREKLEILYKNALALVYPTLNEGFGYPPLECMKYGVPVIISDIGPLAEVCNSAAIYVSPRSIPSIQKALEKAVKNMEILFSYLERKKKYERYKIVTAKQKADLERLVNIICSC